MNRRSIGHPLALLLLVAACGKDSGDSDGPDREGERDGGDSKGDGDGDTMIGDTDAGDATPEACSSNTDCAAPSNACLLVECKSGTCELSARADGFACDDNDACSQTDQCVAGVCTGSDRVECAASNACHDVGTCDPASGVCSMPIKADGAECSETGLCKTGECEEPVVVLARQDFELTPATPTWGFTGTPSFRDGYSSATAGPPSSAIGIGGSRAWETTQVSDGSTIDLDNVAIPAGFDSAHLRFRVAAMDLTGTGGPDNPDYLLVSLSIDGGEHYYDRLRIRGAADGNSYWGYDATGIASVAHTPASETLFQAGGTGLQTTLGYSTVEISFDNTVTQVKVRLTARSSSSSDTWLVDDVVLTAERQLSAP